MRVKNKIMKKTIFTLIFLLLFLFSASHIAFAQYSQTMIPGVNCGVAGDIDKNKCCYPAKMEDVYLPDFGTVFNAVSDIIMKPGMVLVKKMIQPWKDYQDQLSVPCLQGTQSTSDPTDINCRCNFDGATPTPMPLAKIKEFCQKHKDTNEVKNCEKCTDEGGVWSGIGCVQTDLKRFITETVFGMGVGLAGGIALLCIIYAAFMMQTSQGTPDKVKKAQELMTSCIMGLIFIIFSVFILKLIGVNILKIPGFQ